MYGRNVSNARKLGRFPWRETRNRRQLFERMRPPAVNIQPQINQRNQRNQMNQHARHVGFTEFDKSSTPSNSSLVKFLWFAVYVLCTIVCLTQLNERVRLYLQYPVSVSISVLRFKEMEYPAIVFCYTNPPFRQNNSAYLNYLRWIPPCESHTDKCKWENTLLNSTLKYTEKDVRRYSSWWQAQKMNKTFSQFHKELIRENMVKVELACTDMKYWCTEERQKPYLDYFKARNTTLQRIWNESNVPERYINIQDSDCSDIDVENCATKSTFYSIIGCCHVVRRGKPVPYKGDKTSLQITFSDLYYRRIHQIAFGVYFQSNGPVNLNSIHTTVVEFSPGYNANVRVAIKKFVKENSTSRPCLDLKVASDCINECFLNELGLSLNCRIPLMEKAYHLEECGSWDNLSLAIQEALEVYNHFNSNKCNCPPQCEDNVYTVRYWDKPESRSSSDMKLTLGFADNLVEVITESLSYKVAALISDIGGNLGIFLGASIITLIEVLDGLLKRICKATKKSPFHTKKTALVRK